MRPRLAALFLASLLFFSPKSVSGQDDPDPPSVSDLPGLNETSLPGIPSEETLGRDAWVASTTTARPSSAARDKIFVSALRGRYLSLDPASIYDLTSFSISANLYETLIRFAPGRNDVFEPHLARRLPSIGNGLLSKDGKTYTFEIRNNIYFHDGTLLRAEDVRYSLMRFMIYDRPGGPSHLLLKPILGIDSVRDLDIDAFPKFRFKTLAKRIRAEGNTLTIRLAKTSDTFFKILASLPIIVSKDWAVSNGDWDGREATWKRFSGEERTVKLDHSANGTGPFKLDRVERNGDYVILKRHKDYWRGPADLEEIHFRVVPKTSMRLLLLQNGDIDFAYLPPRTYRHARELPGIVLLEELPHLKTGDVLFFNFDIVPGAYAGAGITPEFFQDDDVREGFSLAFDRERYLREALEGRGVPAKGPVPQALKERVRKWKDRRYSLVDAAKRLKLAHGGKLWEQGFSMGMGFDLGNVSRRVAAEILRDGLAVLNPRFKITLHAIPKREFAKAFQERQLPIFVSGLSAEYPDPYPFLFNFYHSGGFYGKSTGIKEEALDLDIDDIRRETHPAKRMKKILKLERKANKKFWHIHTYEPKKFMALRDNVRGLDREQNMAALESRGLLYYYTLRKEIP